MFRSSFTHPRKFNRSAAILTIYGGLTLIALLWLRIQGRPNVLIHSSFASSYRSVRFFSSWLLGIALGLLIVLITRIFQERSSSVKILHNEFHHLLASLSAREVFLLAAASAIGEEFLFRGALLSWLTSLFSGTLGTVIGVVGSSFLFSLIHIGPSKRFLSWTISSFLVGILLALTYIEVGDLVAPISAHFIVNWLNLRDIVKRPRPAPNASSF